MDSEPDHEVLVVGAGVAGLSAGIFTARAGLATTLVDAGGSILERNAHLENYPGFPAGIDARLFLEMTRDQADRAGAAFETGRVVDVRPLGEGRLSGAAAGVVDPVGFSVDVERSADGTDPDEETGSVETVTARQVVAASWSDAEYLRGIDGVDLEDRGSKTFVLVDDRGRTDVPGLYAAGRIADQYHQTVVAAGHGATAGITAVHDSPVELYHDWVTPERYFTGRDREVPPGCEEIDDGERRAREDRAREVVREYVAQPLDETPTMHPSVDPEG